MEMWVDAVEIVENAPAAAVGMGIIYKTKLFRVIIAL